MRRKQRKTLLVRMQEWIGIRIVECSLGPCRRFSIVHPWRRTSAGISLHGRWYCSPACLEDAVDQTVQAKLREPSPFPRRPPRLPFRLILLDKGVVSSEQLERARREQATVGRGEEFGDTLIRLGFATEKEVANARAIEAGHGVYPGDAQPIPPAFLLPVSLMRMHAAAPVHYAPASGRLLLGFVYRVNHDFVDAIEQVTGCEVQACLITRSMYEEQLAGFEAERMLIQVALPDSDLEIVPKAIVGQAIRTEAEQVRVARVGGVLWARLSGGPRELDLLFELEDRIGEGEHLSFPEDKTLAAPAQLALAGRSGRVF